MILFIVTCWNYWILCLDELVWFGYVFTSRILKFTKEIEICFSLQCNPFVAYENQSPLVVTHMSEPLTWEKWSTFSQNQKTKTKNPKFGRRREWWGSGLWFRRWRRRKTDRWFVFLIMLTCCTEEEKKWGESSTCCDINYELITLISLEVYRVFTKIPQIWNIILTTYKVLIPFERTPLEFTSS